MGAIVIEHMKVADLPDDWRAQLSPADDRRVTVRIEEESTDPATAIEDDPLFGMWQDREEMADVEDHLRNIRNPRF